MTATTDLRALLEALTKPQWRTNRGHLHSYLHKSTIEAFAAGRNQVIDELRAILTDAHPDPADDRADLDAVRRQAAAEALREAADKWQWGGWTILTAPTKAAEQPQRIIGAAQAVTDWLRDRADAAAKPDGGGREVSGIEAVLAAHRLGGSEFGPDGVWFKYVCACGEANGDHTWHELHVAAAITAHLTSDAVVEGAAQAFGDYDDLEWRRLDPRDRDWLTTRGRRSLIAAVEAS